MGRNGRFDISLGIAIQPQCVRLSANCCLMRKLGMGLVPPKNWAIKSVGNLIINPDKKKHKSKLEPIRELVGFAEIQ